MFTILQDSERSGREKDTMADMTKIVSKTARVISSWQKDRLSSMFLRRGLEKISCLSHFYLDWRTAIEATFPRIPPTPTISSKRPSQPYLIKR